MSAHPFYFSGDPYLSVMKGVYQALCSEEPFIKLIGAEQTGKTALCEKLTLFMRKKGRRVIFFDCVIQSPEELRLVLIKELRLPERHNFSRQLEQLLPNTDEERVTIIFDNVEQYSITTLLDVARLAEIQGGSRRVLNLVLCGDSSLNQRLSSNADFLGLNQRISHSFVLGPMRSDGLSAFYMDYFSKADMEEVHLEPQALALAYRATGGLPGPAAQIGKAIAESRVGMQELTAVSRLELIGFLKTLSMESGLRANASALLEGQGRVYLPVFAVLLLVTIAYAFSRGDEAAPLSPLNSGVSGEANQATDSVDLAIVTVGEEIALRSAQDETASSPENSSPSPFADDNAETEAQPAIQVSPPILSLEEPRTPVTDSGLSLVTAAERGIDADQIVTPVFEDFIAEQQQLSDPSSSSSELVATVNAEPELVEASAASEIAAAVEEIATQASIDSELTEEIADSTTEVDQAQQQSAVAASPEVDEVDAPLASTQSPSEVETDSQSLTQAQEPTAQVQQLTAEAAIPEPVFEPEPEPEPELVPRDYIDQWVTAWETQNIEGYLSAYHTEFRPRYFDSRSEWRRTRERNIARPEWIRLELSDVEVTESSASEVEMVFWLSYESPSYRDRTRKRVVLADQDGRWLITEEVNLEVRKE